MAKQIERGGNSIPSIHRFKYLIALKYAIGI